MCSTLVHVRLCSVVDQRSVNAGSSRIYPYFNKAVDRESSDPGLLIPTTSGVPLVLHSASSPGALEP